MKYDDKYYSRFDKNEFERKELHILELFGCLGFCVGLVALMLLLFAM